eukprot:2763233-Prymnesium_polylepis.1
MVSISACSSTGDGHTQSWRGHAMCTSSTSTSTSTCMATVAACRLPCAVRFPYAELKTVASLGAFECKAVHVLGSWAQPGSYDE